MKDDALKVLQFDFEFKGTRFVVMETAIEIEYHVVSFLKAALDFKEDAITLGDGSKRLTFDKMIDLILDLKYFKIKSEADSFRMFAEIRNKFLHVRDCITFQVLFDKYLKDRKKKIETYMDEVNGTELSYQIAFVRLYAELLQRLIEFKILTIENTNFKVELVKLVEQKHKNEKEYENILKDIIVFIREKLIQSSESKEILNVLNNLEKILNDVEYEKQATIKHVKIINKLRNVKML